VKLSREEQMARYMVLGTNGLTIPKAPFLARFGVRVDDVFGEVIRRLESWGLVHNTADQVALTLRGMLYLANVGKSFCTERNRVKPHPAGVDLQRGRGDSLIGISSR
jgi:oxygen-independent coproporphyrinogen-3 oxidase